MDLKRVRIGLAVAFIAVFVSACASNRSANRPVPETPGANDIADEIWRDQNPGESQTTLFDFFRTNEDAGRVGAWLVELGVDVTTPSGLAAQLEQRFGHQSPETS